MFASICPLSGTDSLINQRVKGIEPSSQPWQGRDDYWLEESALQTKNPDPITGTEAFVFEFTKGTSAKIKPLA